MEIIVQMETKFLSKYECLLEAERLIIIYRINVQIEKIAQVIYFNAKMYNIACKNYIIPYSLRDFIKNKCNPISIKYDGVSKFKQFLYKTVWKFL